MVKNRLRIDSELIQLGYEESLNNDEIEIFCEPCFETFNEKVEASHEAFNVEMCYDCYTEFCE